VAVDAEGGDAVAAADARFVEEPDDAARAPAELAVAVLPLAVDDRRARREDGGGALEEEPRAERHLR
jgi:hypothetical protein